MKITAGLFSQLPSWGLLVPGLFVPPIPHTPCAAVALLGPRADRARCGLAGVLGIPCCAQFGGRQVPGARKVNVTVQEDATPSASDLDLPKKPWRV